MVVSGRPKCLSLDRKLRNLPASRGAIRPPVPLRPFYVMDIEAARQQMIRQQVRAWDVLDPAVLEVLARVPRERFVPPEFRELAFADTSIPLPGSQAMLAPKIHGRILQALELRPGQPPLPAG